MHPRARFVLPALAALIALLAAAGVLAALGGFSGGSSAPGSFTGTAAAGGFDGAALAPAVPAPNFTLTDQDGRPLSLSELRGHVTILTFLYSTCASACVVIAQQIRGALDELGPGVPAVAVSVDPAGDTPARVRAFLQKTGLGGRLRYLTGSPAALARVWHAYGVVPASAGEAAYARTAPVLLLDRAGAERVLYELEQLTPEALAHDVRKLQGG